MNSDPNADYERPPHIKKQLAELDDPADQQTVARAEKVLIDLERANRRHEKWTNVGDGGTPQGLDLQEARLAEMEGETLAAVIPSSVSTIP